MSRILDNFLYRKCEDGLTSFQKVIFASVGSCVCIVILLLVVCLLEVGSNHRQMLAIRDLQVQQASINEYMLQIDKNNNIRRLMSIKDSLLESDSLVRHLRGRLKVLRAQSDQSDGRSKVSDTLSIKQLLDKYGKVGELGW